MAILWLVNDMTGSPFAVTLVNFARMGPMIFFSLVGGLVVDRFDRRNVLIFSLLAASILSLVLLVLVHTGAANLWNIILVSFLGGVATSFNHPARQTMIPNLVRREHLMNAISLDTASVMAGRIVAAPVAGVLIQFLGVGPVFGFRAGGAAIAIVWLLLIPPMPPPGDAHKRDLVQDMKQAFAYLREQPLILGQVFLWALPSLGSAAFTALLPGFCTDVLKVGPIGYGILQSATGFGSLIGLLGLAAVPQIRRRGLAMLMMGLVMGLTLVGFAYSPWFATSMVLTIGFSGSNTSLYALNNAVIQEMLVDKMRGRVMSLREVMSGLGPAGSLMVGSAADIAGLTIAGAGLGAILVAIPLTLMLVPNRMRGL